MCRGVQFHQGFTRRRALRKRRITAKVFGKVLLLVVGQGIVGQLHHLVGRGLGGMVLVQGVPRTVDRVGNGLPVRHGGLDGLSHRDRRRIDRRFVLLFAGGATGPNAPKFAVEEVDEGFCFKEVGGGLWGVEWGGHVGGGRVGGGGGGGGGWQSHEVGDDVGRHCCFATQLSVNGMGGGQKGSGEQSRREEGSGEGSGGGGVWPPARAIHPGNLRKVGVGGRKNSGLLNCPLLKPQNIGPPFFLNTHELFPL